MFSWARGEQEGRGRHRKREVRRLSQEIWSQWARGWGSCACWVGFPEMCTLSYSFHSGSGLLFLAGQRQAAWTSQLLLSAPPSSTHPLAAMPVTQASSLEEP